MNLPNSFKKCLVTHKILQNFPALQLVYIEHLILHQNFKIFGLKHFQVREKHPIAQVLF